MVFRRLLILIFLSIISSFIKGQVSEKVKFIKLDHKSTIQILIGKKLFTEFLYPDTLEKPVLFPIYASNDQIITRGFPLIPIPGESTDHPHHLGLWFSFENVNGLDFWNNSYAIPKSQKSHYGWIRTDPKVKTFDGEKGILIYQALWMDQSGETLLEETTHFEFSGSPGQRVIKRNTVLKAKKDILFKDAKDGLLGLRLTKALEIPGGEESKLIDPIYRSKTKPGEKKIYPGGSYLTSEGKLGNAAWGTRGVWCKNFGKPGRDSISITIFDHPKNPNYPTYWHARGYGLFAANPLGEHIFTDGKSEKNFSLKKGDSMTFFYKILIQNGANTPNSKQLNQFAQDFAKEQGFLF